jgi:Domain of unknown function (DUF4203)
MHPIVEIVAGLLLLLAGRRLFWLFIAIVGFVAGAEIAREMLASRSDWVVWVFGAGAGIVGAVAAMLFQRVAFALAGFYAGSYLSMVIAQSLGWSMPDFALILVGGVIGALVAALVMDWAIIVLSTLVGVGMIVGALDLLPLHLVILASVLAALGIVVQSSTVRKRPGRPDDH